MRKIPFSEVDPVTWVILGFVFLVILVAGFTHTARPENYNAEEERIQAETRKKVRFADSMINDMVYFKDTRTGLCFASTEFLGDDRTRTLACVPCEQVEHLLVSPAQPPQE